MAFKREYDNKILRISASFNLAQTEKILNVMETQKAASAKAKSLLLEHVDKVGDCDEADAE